ncbi:YbfB/YjiJ family MFS transporter [Providencia burhodogranariea]|uniref:Transport protein n=1 Tax=Providencia burhodogranariea DSM 19968 TaxID=1141662 RepID=K8WWF8_9GAMM|nr:YbfB/YjiJ family MFS transporter [Providencia burhodogranariea]EKT61747.1 transport protein [Providencia burhodogranariea DSM 19968]
MASNCEQTQSSRSAAAFHIAFSGFLSLIVVMGIGRFTLTPQVPLMLEEHQLTLSTASVVAAFNYFGYLLGSFDAMRARRYVEWRMLLGVWGAVTITLLSALLDGPILHSIARFFIGWASGMALVLIVAWANESLARLNRPALSVAVFAGTGFGIFISGIFAVGIQDLQLSASQGWLIYGVIALILSLYINRYLPRLGQWHRPIGEVEKFHLTPAIKRLVWSYGLAGFGYILPATFLSQMATQRFPNSLFAQFIWPVFGISAVVGILLAMLLRHLSTTQNRLAFTLWLQAIGILIAEIVSGISGLVIGAILIGGGFMCAVQLSMQLGRELAPNHNRFMAGLLTTIYAIGQLAGPVLSFISTSFTGKLDPALYTAFIALSISGLLVYRRSC